MFMTRNTAHCKLKNSQQTVLFLCTINILNCIIEHLKMYRTGNHAMSSHWLQLPINGYYRWSTGFQSLCLFTNHCSFVDTVWALPGFAAVLTSWAPLPAQEHTYLGLYVWRSPEKKSLCVACVWWSISTPLVVAIGRVTNHAYIYTYKYIWLSVSKIKAVAIIGQCDLLSCIHNST